MDLSSKRILLVGVCDVEGSTTVDIRKALVQMGIWVDVFNYRTVEKFRSTGGRLARIIEKAASYLRQVPIGMPFRRLYFFFPARSRMNRYLIAASTEQMYDLVLFFKTDTVDWMTLKTISAHTPTWYFFMDPPDEARRIQAWRYAQHASFCSATFSSVVSEFKRVSRRAHWIIEGEAIENFSMPRYETDDSDVVFVGNADAKRQLFIDSLRDHGIDVVWYGNGGSRPPIIGSDLARVYASSKIVLNINREGDGFSNRVLQALFSEAFVLSEDSSDLRACFQKKVHLDTFHDVTDCALLIRHYLTDSDHRHRIAKKGYEYAIQQYTWQAQLTRLLTIAFNSQDRSDD